MADITEAVHQQEVADSILDAPIVATLSHEGNFIEAAEGFSDAPEGESQFENPEDYLAQAVFDQEHDAQKLGDDGLRAKLEREGIEPEQREAAPEREQAQEGQEQPHTATPAEIQAGIEQLDNVVKEYGLNEPADAREFASDFCGAFGSDIFKAGVDVESLGGVMSKTALSALNVYRATGGDLSKIGEIPEQSAQAFAHDLLKGMGVDPRSINVDAMLLARTTLGGMVNFLRTYDAYGGKVTDLAKLNDPRQAEFYLQNFVKAFGQDGPVNREAAVRFADACAKQLLRVVGKISQVNAQRAQEQQRQPRSRGPRVPAGLRDGVRGSKAPRWKTNQDIFDGATMDFYHQQHGRL